jgi:hypothetical protein
MEYLPIGVSPTGFPVEVEGRGEVDRLGGLLDNLFENLLNSVSSSLFTRLFRPPSDLPGGESEFLRLTSLGNILVRFFMVVTKPFLETLEICGCSLTVMITAKGDEGCAAVVSPPSITNHTVPDARPYMWPSLLFPFRCAEKEAQMFLSFGRKAHGPNLGGWHLTV